MEERDHRLSALREFVLAIKEGRFRQNLPVSFEGNDDVDLLGTAMLELSGELEKKFNEARYLARITEQINEGIILDEVLNDIYDSFQPIIPYDRLGLSFIDDDGKTVRSYWTRSSKPIKLKKGFSAELKGSSLQRVIRTGIPRIINDLEEYEKKHPESLSTKTILSEGIMSSLTCPLIAMGKPVGFLFFSSLEKKTYKDMHVDIFRQIAGQLSIIVEKSRIYERMTDITRRLELSNSFIRKVFGRYVSDDVVDSLLQSEDSLRIGGEKRELTILMSDIRGFSQISERYPAEETVAILNAYLERMVDVIHRYNGTINEILGDSILVIFGAPVSRNDDHLRSLACAIEMQNVMEDVNRENRKKGYPALAMGIAINSGSVIVGNIGSEKRAKYGIVGSQVNLTARIESFTVGGQILISGSTKEKCGKRAIVSKQIDFNVKGFSKPIKAFDLKGIKSRNYNLTIPSPKEQPEKSDDPILIDYGFYRGKKSPPVLFPGKIIAVSKNMAMIQGESGAHIHDGIRVHIKEHGDALYSQEIDGKVTEIKSKDGKRFIIYYTYIPPGPADILDRVLSETLAKRNESR